MTMIDIRRLPAVRARGAPGTRNVVIFAAAAGAVTFLIRLALFGRSFDLFGDEILYVDLGRSVTNGGIPRYDGPFFLHGPAFFYLEAAWIHLVGSPQSIVGWVYEMRILNALMAGATAVVLVLLAARIGSLWSGAAAGLLFALDPFCIRQNDRVLLETSMMLWVMLGYLVLISLIGRPRARGNVARALLAGVFFGLAALTKDEGALLSIPPLLTAVALGWGPSRRLMILIVVTTTAIYAAYVAVVYTSGYLSLFLQAKFTGVERMLGLIQSTGFHSAQGGSLKARILAEAGFFGTTYLLLAVAVAAALVALIGGRNEQRLMVLLYFAAGATLGYAVVLGTLEEQELYLLTVPSLLIISTTTVILRPSGRYRKRSARRLPPGAVYSSLIIAAVVFIFTVNFFTIAQWLRQPDDGFARLIQYMTTHVSQGTRVGVVDGDIETPYALGYSYYVGYWETSAALAQQNVRYVVVEWGPIEQGYSDQTPAEVRHLVNHGRIVFSFDGRTYGNLDLYQMPASKKK